MEWRSDEHADSVKLTEKKTRIDAAHRIKRQRDAGIWENVFLMHFNAFIHHLDGVLNCVFDFGVHMECMTLQQRHRKKNREGERRVSEWSSNSTTQTTYAFQFIVIVCWWWSPPWQSPHDLFGENIKLDHQCRPNEREMDSISISYLLCDNEIRRVTSNNNGAFWIGSVRFGSVELLFLFLLRLFVDYWTANS